MLEKRDKPADRRSFLSGEMVLSKIEQTGNEIADQLDASNQAPPDGNTLRLSQRTMACDFSVIMNPGLHERVMDASAALDLVAELEDQLTVYRDTSEVSKLNANAAIEPVQVEPKLFDLLKLSQRICIETENCFDITSGTLIELWKNCRSENRIPTQSEIDSVLTFVGPTMIELGDDEKTIRFNHSNTRINFGGIGKGYALDRSKEKLIELQLDDFLLHGGHSSLMAQGDHNETGGWPVGIGNPLFPDRRLATLILTNQAMSTSGSNIQYFRHQGRRYGHILDPRTGWPVEGLLSVTVLAPSAAVADAFSTAFFVMGVEKTVEFCTKFPDVGAILVPFPKGDRRVRPTVVGIDESCVFWDETQIHA